MNTRDNVFRVSTARLAQVSVERAPRHGRFPKPFRRSIKGVYGSHGLLDVRPISRARNHERRGSWAGGQDSSSCGGPSAAMSTWSAAPASGDGDRSPADVRRRPGSALTQGAWLARPGALGDYGTPGSGDAPVPIRTRSGLRRRVPSPVRPASGPFPQRRPAHGPASRTDGTEDRHPGRLRAATAARSAARATSASGTPRLDLTSSARPLPGRRPAAAPVPFTLSSARGTANAGHDRRRPAQPAQLRPLDAEVPPAAGGESPRAATPPPGGTWQARRPCTTTADTEPPRSGRTCSSCSARRRSESSRTSSRRSATSRPICSSLEPPKYPFPDRPVAGRTAARPSSRRPAPRATAPTARGPVLPDKIVRSR